jgi:hypothetical protein
MSQVERFSTEFTEACGVFAVKNNAIQLQDFTYMSPEFLLLVGIQILRRVLATRKRVF